MNRIALFTFLAAVSACSQTNKDHCGNRQGDLTCQQQDDGSHPICSSCEAANNGCVAADVELDESCHAETVADTSTSNGSDPSTDPTTSASQSTSQTSPSTTMATDDTQTTDPVTTTMTTSSEDTSTTDATSAETSSSTTTTDPVTTDPSESSSTGMDPCGNGVIDPGEPCEGEDLQGETCESQGTASGVLACNELCQFDLSGCMPLPTCGDGVLNGDEQCDGDDFSAANCDALNPGLYGSGDLSCNDDCTFDTSDCCIGVGNGCNANTNCCNDCALALCL